MNTSTKSYTKERLVTSERFKIMPNLLKRNLRKSKLSITKANMRKNMLLYSKQFPGCRNNVKFSETKHCDILEFFRKKIKN